MTSALDRRVSRLETIGPAGCVVMWRHHSETTEQAALRWHVEHPGQRLDPNSLRVIITRWSGPQPIASEAEKGTP